MFEKYIVDQSPAERAKKILVMDDDHLREKYDIAGAFGRKGFETVYFKNDVDFRVEYEEKIENPDSKVAVFAESKNYIPFDMQKRLARYVISMQKLFPGIYGEVQKRQTDVSLVITAYQNNFVKGLKEQDAGDFFRNVVYSKENVRRYIDTLWDEIEVLLEDSSYESWLRIADKKAEIDVLANRFDVSFDTSAVHEPFKQYVLGKYGKLSSKIGRYAPVLVNGAMEYMHEHSDKFVIIVMDGMSEFDWRILSDSFEGIRYRKASTMAMIPTTTSVSRQCLLSGKLPSQLIDPWKQANEKKEFVSSVRELGYADEQIGYERGYDAQFSDFVKCGAVIIMDCDEMVHAQKQGKKGMYQDIKLLSNDGKLAALVKRLLKKEFDIYITADHGNTTCTGVGKLTGAGVEVETKSRRMVVLKDFADKEALRKKADLVDYPGYYLPKEFDYAICDTGVSFDTKGEQILSHGGITLDEVVVPFIKIKAVENNG